LLKRTGPHRKLKGVGLREFSINSLSAKAC